MYLVYIDESGDPGFGRRGYTRTDAFVLSALLIHESRWHDGLNQLIAFRKFLKNTYGVRMGDELRAYDLVNNKGDFAHLNLSDKSRLRIYRKALQLQVKLGYMRTWAVVIDKRRFYARYPNLNIREIAWTNMIERLERFSSSRREPCMIFPDNGTNKQVQARLRRMRRFSRPNAAYGGARLNRNADLIIEDPNFRISHSSYFVQFADLNAYAAARRVFPRAWFGEKYWEYLGTSRVLEVNSLEVRRRRRIIPRGIVLKP